MVMHLNNVFQDVGNQGWDNPPLNDPVAHPEGVGVFLTQWDAMHHPDKLWMPCQSDDWCSSMSHRYSASVVNHHTPGLWSRGLGGFVISSKAAVLRCGFSGDGSTQGPGDPCPADVGREGGKGRKWCEEQRDWRIPKSEPWFPTFGTASFPYGDGTCAYRPEHLHVLNREQAYMQGGEHAAGYNELIMESKPYADLLPHSIDAVFYQPDSTGAQIRQAKLTHENFLREYGDAVKGVPLVIYEGRVNRQSKRPFKLAPGK